jgi:glycosyltransferase involved in cell wall biosynthesis
MNRSPDRLTEDPVRRAIFITATEPEPRRYGKPVVIGGILDHLCDRLGSADVHLVLIGRPEVERPAVPYQRHVLAKPGTREQVVSVLRHVVLPLLPGNGGRHRRPLQESVLYSDRLAAALRATIERIDPDLEIWDTIRMGQYVEPNPLAPEPHRRSRPTRRILYADDLFSERYAAMLREIDAGGATGNPGGEFVKLLPGPARRMLASPRVHRPLLRLERDLVAASEQRQPAWFDATYLISPDETARLQARCPDAEIGTLPPLLPEPRGSGSGSSGRSSGGSSRIYPGTPEFTFIGGFDYAPNLDGLNWFLSTCRAAVRAELPDVAINVVGSGTGRGLQSAAGWGTSVRFLGWVDDLDAVLAGSAALLSPLRTGSGVKIKVLEALARSLPVVATAAGVQGIEGGELSGCLIGDSPQALAAAMRAAVDPATNRRLSAAARQTWDQHYSPAVVRRRYDQIFGIGDSNQGVRTAG